MRRGGGALHGLTANLTSHPVSGAFGGLDSAGEQLRNQAPDQTCLQRCAVNNEPESFRLKQKFA